jgi:hypothetical protein
VALELAYWTAQEREHFLYWTALVEDIAGKECDLAMEPVVHFAEQCVMMLYSSHPPSCFGHPITLLVLCLELVQMNHVYSVI